MARIPGVHIETQHNPATYSQGQLDLACRLAFVLKRGRLLLLEAPELAEDDA